MQQEIEPWGSPAGRRPLKQYNYQYNRPTIFSRNDKNRVTKTSKKVKQQADVSYK